MASRKWENQDEIQKKKILKALRESKLILIYNKLPMKQEYTV